MAFSLLHDTGVNAIDHLRAARAGVDQWLATRAGGSALWVGRANAGLACALEAAVEPGRAVVFPAVLCPSPVFTAASLGYRVLFCDVRADDYTMDPARLAELLERRDDIGAVVVAHLYGHAADVRAVAALCRDRNVLVVNDVAQAIGGTCAAGRALGDAGDVALYSFGHTKHVDAGGGGVVVVRRPGLEEPVRRAVGRLPLPPDDVAARGVAYRGLYYAIRDAARDAPDAVELYEHAGRLFAGSYRYRYVDDSGRTRAIADGIARLDERLEGRRRRAGRLRELLGHPALRHPRVDLDAIAPWRYTLEVLDGRRDDVANALRAAGFDASPWYPALHRWFASGRAQTDSFPVAESLASRLLNLWVDGAAGDSSNDPDAVAEAVLRSLGQTSVAAVR